MTKRLFVNIRRNAHCIANNGFTLCIFKYTKRVLQGSRHFIENKQQHIIKIHTMDVYMRRISKYTGKDISFYTLINLNVHLEHIYQYTTRV